MSALGRYEVLQQLGSGSMGIVYRGRDKGLGREVALKVMRTESQIFPEISERFSREASVCARLNHRNIVTILRLRGSRKFFVHRYGTAPGC